ncbi:MAG: amidohydrolase family protein [Acidimicrobiales bacterium]
MTTVASALTLFTNATVLDRNGRRRADVVVDRLGGEVVAVESGIDATGLDVIDVSGCVITPGFVDLATHLREPGDEAAENIRSGSRAAACGGYTAVVAMPDTEPCLDSASTLAMVRSAAVGVSCEIAAAGAISAGRRGTELAPIGELADLGVRIFTDNGRGVQNPQLLRRALEYADSIDSSIVRMQSGAIGELAAGSVMHVGPWSVRLGLAGQPSLAEDLFVQRDLALAALTGARLHLQVSTSGAVEAVRRAKADGVRVTASVSPHHLVLTDAVRRVRSEIPHRAAASRR